MRRLYAVVRLRKARAKGGDAPGQLGLFGGSQGPARVKAHVRHTKGGKVATVTAHTRKTERATPEPAAEKRPVRIVAEPWNAPIVWTREANDGAQWRPSRMLGFGPLVVFKNPQGHRRHGLYSVYAVERSVPLGMTEEREGTGQHPMFQANNIREVRGYLKEVWELNNRTPEQEAAAATARAEKEAAQKVEQEATRKHDRERDAANDRWRAQEIERKAAQVAADKKTDAWMADRRRYNLKPRQVGELRAALERHGLVPSDSYEVHDLAELVRSDRGGSWGSAYEYAAKRTQANKDRA